MQLHLAVLAVSTSWLSFGTARRRVLAPSHFERGLKPAQPGLSLGVFRRFGTMAYIHAVASPNEVLFSATLYYRIMMESRKNVNFPLNPFSAPRLYGIGFELTQSIPTARTISAGAAGLKSKTS